MNTAKTNIQAVEMVDVQAINAQTKQDIIYAALIVSIVFNVSMSIWAFI